MCNPCHRWFPHSHNTIPLIRQSNGKSIQHWKAANPLGNPSNSERLQSHIKFQPQTRYPVKYVIIIQYAILIFKSTIQNENTDYREVRLPDSEKFQNLPIGLQWRLRTIHDVGSELQSDGLQNFLLFSSIFLSLFFPYFSFMVFVVFSFTEW